MSCKRCAADAVTDTEPARRAGKASVRAPPDYGLLAADAFRTPGHALPVGLQTRFGSSLGADFSSVRIHDDAFAAQAAAGLGARAFAVDEHIAFARDSWAPNTPSGDWLIAHELAHVVQQRRGHAAVQTHSGLSEPGDPAEREADAAAGFAVRGLRAAPLVQPAARVSLFPYQTVGTTIDRANIATLSGQSYWVNRTNERFDIIPSTRMAADPEEQAAVLAALWASNPPATVTSSSERIVPVNPRPAAAAASGSAAPSTPPPALLYRFKFDPPVPPATKPQLTCEFIASGVGAVPVAAPAPATGFLPGTLNANSSGFPAGRDAYFTAHPQEFAQLMSFLAGAPPVVDQHLTTETRNTSGRVTHTSLLHVVRAAATGGGAGSLDVDLIAEQAPLAAVTAPADYLTRDATDFEIEKRQRTSLPTANRLGTVTLPPGLTPAEHLAVNHAITAYFDTNSRNTEVDAIIPVGATGTATEMFTLRFGAGNAVTVERIGTVGTGTGMVDPSRIDVTRVAGFPGVNASDSALRAWWTARYPAGGPLQTPAPPAPPAGTAAAAPNNTALIAEMNRLITAGIANVAWFTGNYRIEPLGPAAATARLRNTHHAPPDTDPTLGTLADGTKAFSAADLRLLELALETASTTVLSALQGVKLIRMTNPIDRTSGGAWQNASATTYGFTVRDGTERSTLLFDRFTSADSALFRGSSAANARPDSTMSILHELGHAAGSQGGVETAFNAWRAAHPQVAQTWYAASAGTEVFPEAFALFQTDPHFLCASAPLLYAWFLEWTRSGTPPAANATLAAPTVCPP